MKTPPVLIGAALVFWGWQADLLTTGIVMAAIIESSRFVKARWEFSNDDFSRIWSFCAVLFLAAGAYAFTASNGPSRLSELASSSGSLAAQNAVGVVTTKTAVLLIRWLPIPFFLFIVAQTFSDREGIPLETISLILRRRWKKAREAGQPTPASQPVNVAYPYVIGCLFAASSHPVTEYNTFFWGLCAILAWAMWWQRSLRFNWLVWIIIMGLAVLTGYEGQLGLVRLKHSIDQYNPSWLGGLASQSVDPVESRTALGRIGKIQTSSQIVIRLETPAGNPPPTYLREAVYRIWYAGSSKDDFANVSEIPPNSGEWPLLNGKTNSDTVNIACYLHRGSGLLPLPASSGLLKQLPAFLVQKNGVGAVRAEGPGLVIFDAHYGPGAILDHAPETNEDTAVPDKEKPALSQIISELHLEGQSHEQTIQTIAHFFGTKFTYSLWQDAPAVKDTNSTALSRFLLETRSGHCEYFATATVLLLRELGSPARYSVGYAVHETSGNKYVVRLSDAHAWCRVWNPASGTWEDLDTTPGVWITKEQEKKSAFQFLGDSWSRLVFEFSKLRWGQGNLRGYILWSLVPVLALLLYQIILRSGKRRKIATGNSVAEDDTRPGLDSELYQLESELSKRGLIRNPSEPFSAWLQRIAEEPEFSPFRDILPSMLRLHYRYRFDPKGLNDNERESLRSEVAACLSGMTAKR